MFSSLFNYPISQKLPIPVSFFIILCNGTDNFARITDSYGVARDIFHNNAAAANYETAKTKYDALQENLSERSVKRERIEIYLKELSRAENLVTEFDEGIWNTMVDTLTIYSKERIVFRFRDGSEIEWSIR